MNITHCQDIYTSTRRQLTQLSSLRFKLPPVTTGTQSIQR